MDAKRGDPVAAELGDAIETALREHAGQSSNPLISERRLFVFISDMPAAPGDDFLVRLVAVAYEDEVATTEPLACVACGADELSAIIIGVLPPMLDALAAVEPPTSAAPPPELVIVEDESSPEPTRANERKQRALLISGAATATIGALVLGSGAALLDIGKVYPRDADGLAGTLNFYDYTPPGAALVGAGGALLVAGMVCFGLGMRKKPGALTGMSPMMNRNMVGGNLTFAF